jgi:hypothetical protein
MVSKRVQLLLLVLALPLHCAQPDTPAVKLKPQQSLLEKLRNLEKSFDEAVKHFSDRLVTAWHNLSRTGKAAVFSLAAGVTYAKYRQYHSPSAKRNRLIHTPAKGESSIQFERVDMQPFDMSPFYAYLQEYSSYERPLLVRGNLNIFLEKLQKIQGEFAVKRWGRENVLYDETNRVRWSGDIHRAVSNSQHIPSRAFYRYVMNYDLSHTYRRNNRTCSN